MKTQSEPLETLSEIRSMMERSSRFISLNGLSGVFAGIFALFGALAAYLYLKMDLDQPANYNYVFSGDGSPDISFYIFFFTDAALVLFASLAVAVFLSVRKAQKKGIKIWDFTAKRMLFNMLLPLIAGGLFCLLLLYHGWVGLIAPVTLLFYGLALFNTSKYTYNDIRYLGIIEMCLGLIAMVWLGYGLLFWAVGFGLVHIIYGIIMFYKYER
jgi:hypothetical protein